MRIQFQIFQSSSYLKPTRLVCRLVRNRILVSSFGSIMAAMKGNDCNLLRPLGHKAKGDKQVVSENGQRKQF